MATAAARAVLVERIAGMALAAIHREYPSHVSHLLRGDEDARPPRELTPAFYGSFDWHSAVHGHWCLARLARLHPRAPFAGRALSALAASLTPERLAREVEYVAAPGRESFERPYGLAWLLQLAAELREWEREGTGGSASPGRTREGRPHDPPGRGFAGDRAGAAEAAPRTPRNAPSDIAAFRATLEPLEALAVERLGAWLSRLPWPVRTGVHPQTAFALGLALDWARAAGGARFAALIGARARAFFGADEAAPIAYEPSGHDFLSPILGEADLMRRALARDEYAAWLARFLPDLEGAAARHWLTPVESPDPADGHLAHLDGLNLSRAWMLEGIAAALPPDDLRRPALGAAAARHREAGLAALKGGHYAGTHWLGSFAAYLLTGRGLPDGAAAAAGAASAGGGGEAAHGGLDSK